MRKLRAEVHRRMLGNGYCARPIEMDCHFESICESYTFFVTTAEFRPTLQQQRDDAAARGQVGRQKIFDGLLFRLQESQSPRWTPATTLNCTDSAARAIDSTQAPQVGVARWAPSSARNSHAIVPAYVLQPQISASHAAKPWLWTSSTWVQNETARAPSSPCDIPPWRTCGGTRAHGRESRP